MRTSSSRPVGRGLMLAVTLGAVLLGVPQAGSAAQSHTVMVGNSFNPRVLHATAGDLVSWDVTSGSHNAKSWAGAQSFDSGTYGPAAPPYTTTFQGGTTWYRCTLHSSINAFGECQGMCGMLTDTDVAPAVPSITSPADGATLDVNPATFSGTGEAYSKVSIIENGVRLKSAIVRSDGTWSMSIALTEGSHTVVARGYNADGLASEASPPITFTETVAVPDKTKPSPPVITTATNSVFTGTPLIRGSARDNVAVASVTLTFTDALGTTTVQAECPACAAATVTWTAEADLLPGRYTVQARSIDTAGNLSNPSPAIAIYVLAPPNLI